ncbi:MAG TPA: ABC transporter substrate-binding protein [Acidimicrobiales bacterium]|jgi:NitT/TauT family transport system substrate-binding protein|nr:ABC transporter substrate-binding protein [Acidimicrobiales bacterium]
MSITSVGKGVKGLAAVLVAALLAACSGSSAASSSSTTTSTPVTVRVGYFPNITHAVALVGVANGVFARDLAPDKLDATQTFNAGPAETQALLAQGIDIAFIGPSPSITAFTQSHGAVKIISGAASGGAGLVTKAAITSPAQLKGKTIATPQLGNTQDVALRAYLKTQGYRTDLQGGGDVAIKPQSNSQTVTTFKAGSIDGAWVPEPFLSQLVAAGGHVLVDEKTLWPGGKFVTTDVLVRTAFLQAHPATVKRFLQGVVDTIGSLRSDPAGAAAAANRQLTTLGSALPPAVLSASLADMTFTADPLAATLRKEADDAVSAGLSTSADLSGIFDLSLLNQVLTAKGQPAVPTS